MPKDNKTRFTVSLPDTLLADIDSIAEEEHTSRNDLIIEALKMYRDAYYMGTKASVIPQHILAAFEAQRKQAVAEVNDKTNGVLSSLAIQMYVLQQIISRSLAVNDEDVQKYTLQAVEFIRRNNRVFRMDTDGRVNE